MSRVFFSEEQQFSQSPLIYIFAISALAGFGGMGFALVDTYQKGDDMTEILIVCVISSIVLFLLGWGIFTLKLETHIQNQSISFRMPPLINKKRVIHTNEITSAEVIKYNPIRHYGGYGIRYSARHGKAYNIHGDKGLKLVLSSGKKILIGTQKPDALRVAVRKMMENEEDYG
jgi:hypothetical protein